MFTKNPQLAQLFFFAVVPKLAVFVLLIRIFYSSFSGYITKWRYYIVILAVLTIVVGSFGGLEQKKTKKPFSIQLNKSYGLYFNRF